MFDSPVLGVIVGIVFVYLLYSLLASLIGEIISTNLNLRAKVLEQAIHRMLNDDKEQHFWVQLRMDVGDGLKRYANQLQYIFPFWKTYKLEPEKTLAGRFYDQPLIKYLGDNKFFKKPPYLGKENFSKNLIDMLKEMGVEMLGRPDAPPLEKIQAALGMGPHSGQPHPAIEKETLKYLRSLLDDADNDLGKFKLLAEKWFEDTMHRASGWYKKYVQIILFLIGLVLAITFNVDTVKIISGLSKDDKARDRIVQLASDYSRAHASLPNGAKKDSIHMMNPHSYNRRMDSLTKVVDSLLAKDIKNANQMIALGWDAPDRFNCYDTLKEKNVTLRHNCMECLAWVKEKEQTERSHLNRIQKFQYLSCVVIRDPLQIFGFVITALAISMGAPFWFDLLKKMMQLRGDGAKPASNVAAVDSGAEAAEPDK
ncbi:MAG TPA: hypothetical protein VNB90_16890 [Cytophagaceae bacterium]|nr:hypothetical protein [Cytophagaceae bacterium]